ncbi:response regulator [Anaeromyxobacter oryzae]|uniref:DNA-binding response regulator n=1 Tax=Anaeromyxobacter oryzae TaxID=2918170 RepID=A0ABN6MWE7_9BACT|nr:response regulator [Anaeromyxobacter oryzae]BDG04147.1 DNA-binding response regulator [Anaeromyxobacter oryzae]
MTDPGPLVLLVEDEPAVRRFLRAAVTAHGYRLLEAGTVREARQLATSHVPDLYLLDLGLPDGDGIELTRALREWTRAPIIVLSARGREEDKVDALDAGADDYVTKPFGANELLARMRVALRHAQASPKEPTLIEAGPLRVDLERRAVTVSGSEVHLTPIEYKLLVLLARNAGKVLTHRQILSQVWGPNVTQSHYVRVHMAELRKKIEPDPARPTLILTELGVGYRLREAGDGA